MRFVTVALMGWLLSIPVSVARDTQSRGSASIMILGSYHFEPSNSDVSNIEPGDVTSSIFQQELSELIEKLKGYKPTKIAIELLPQYEDGFNEQYQQFVAGHYKLNTNERQQIAMRLGKALAHKKIFAVDAEADFSFDALQDAATQSGEEERLQSIVQHKIPEITNEVEALVLDKTKSVKEVFRLINSPEWLNKNDSVYFEIAPIGNRYNHAGAELVANWYLRNLKIAANVQDIVDDKNDRVLILFGAGHKQQLERALASMGFSIEDPRVYISD